MTLRLWAKRTMVAHFDSSYEWQTIGSNGDYSILWADSDDERAPVVHLCTLLMYIAVLYSLAFPSLHRTLISRSSGN
jgi:hypothetical protein